MTMAENIIYDAALCAEKHKTVEKDITELKASQSKLWDCINKKYSSILLLLLGGQGAIILLLAGRYFVKGSP
jgi:hypothetical protein